MLLGLRPCFAPEEGGAAGGAADTAEVLYPDETPAAGEGAAEAQAPEPAAPADEGLEEFEPDPSLTDEENAAARAAHEANRPTIDPGDQVPADGQYQLAMPEGVAVDQQLLDSVAPVFKELGLSNNQAQLLADKFIEQRSAEQQAAGQRWAETVSGWAEQAAADPAMGGVNWNRTVSNASGFVDRFGSPSLKTYLEASGAGNHPELIRIFALAGAMISEDRPAANDGPQGGKVQRDAASILYPDDKPKG